MKEQILKMVEEIKTEWGLRKALCFLRVLLEEEAKKEKRADNIRPYEDQGQASGNSSKGI